MIANTELLNSISKKAKENPRLRHSFDLRNSESDYIQRMLNALEPGKFMPIHRHRNSSETMIVVKGSLKEYFYDDQGNVIGEWVCAPNMDCIGINIPAGQWHNLVCLESGTVLFESKDGPWSPLADEDILHPDCR